jgi:hypothetical protein
MSPVPTSQSPVVVAAFLSRDEALLSAETLESEKIASEVFPRREDLPRLCADVFDAGFDLVVEAGDADAALAALRRLWPDDVTLEPERCPVCGSMNIRHLPRIRLFAVATFVLLIGGLVTGERDLFLLVIGIVGVLLVMTPVNHCRACRHQWR